MLPDWSVLKGTKLVTKAKKMVHFGEFLKTWSLRSNSVTRLVSFNRTKIGGKCQNSKIQMRHFEWFLNNVTWVSHDWVMILVQVPKKWSRFFFHGKMKNSFEDRFFIKCCRMILDMWMKAWENHEWILWKDFMPMESMNEMVKVWIAWCSKAKKNFWSTLF